MHIKVHSASLPVGAGLGSSAAFSVATAAALYKLRHVLTNTGSSVEWIGQPPSDVLSSINHYAYQAERIIHGTPSGLDNTVSCYGGAIYFQKNINGSITKEIIRNFPPLDILLTNTWVPRSTKLLVAGVRKFKQDFPDVAQGILDSCGAISR